MRPSKLSLAFVVAAIAISGCGALAPKATMTPFTARAVPADWVTISASDPAVSIKVPKDWRNENVDHTTGGSGDTSFTRLLRAASPQEPGHRYLATVMVNVSRTHITLPLTQSSVDGFVRGAQQTAPDTSIIASGAQQLTCGEALMIEQNRFLNVNGQKVLYHQLIYAVPRGSQLYQVFVSSPAENSLDTDFMKQLVSGFAIG